MAKPKKRKKAKKTPQELQAMTTEELMQHVLGPEGHKLVKEHISAHDKPRKNAMRIDHEQG
jgi:hypothetical protein